MDTHRFVLIVVSIVLAALIVRVIYIWYDVLMSTVEEVCDEDYRDHYLRSSLHMGSAVVVTGLCGFIFVVVYLLWKKFLRSRA